MGNDFSDDKIYRGLMVLLSREDAEEYADIIEILADKNRKKDKPKPRIILLRPDDQSKKHDQTFTKMPIDPWEENKDKRREFIVNAAKNNFLIYYDMKNPPFSLEDSHEV